MRNKKTRQPWGQHFLHHQEWCRRIARAGCAHTGVNVLEIGPGKGDLTRVLKETGNRILAVEIDPRFVQRLTKTFQDSVTVLHANILSLTEEEIIQHLGAQWSIVANIPFYITLPIIEKIMSWQSWEQAVLTVQREVGERLVAEPGSRMYGVVSLYVHIFAKREYLMTIDRTAFSPPPQVDAGVVRLVRREKPLIAAPDIDDFMDFVHAAFQGRRKMVGNTLARALKKTKAEIHQILIATDIDPKQRPETINFDQFYHLYQLTQRK
ncbi:MAG: ribosomal RNA small subunit methyltransferase A [Elusimicrobia bacterium]|nr:ribosomal RNA small subunit methyltransferase A [Elusimicrobiota bacterium]MBD3411960.1 ribosomal RNA small subunit methyltransferase A [Elusimicrobiota bacterium]